MAIKPQGRQCFKDIKRNLITQEEVIGESISHGDYSLPSATDSLLIGQNTNFSLLIETITSSTWFAVGITIFVTMFLGIILFSEPPPCYIDVYYDSIDKQTQCFY